MASSEQKSIWKSTGNSVLNEVMSAAAQIGVQALSTLAPNDFECYMIALELADCNNQTIDYITFPIMPRSITKTLQNRNTIKKSMTGVTVLQSNSLALGEITINGNFGRSFKNLVESKTPASGVAAYGVSKGKYSLYSLIQGDQKKSLLGGLVFQLFKFGFGVKSGYGVTKIIQAIVDKSVGVDDKGRPFKLFFHNMAFGESYQVVVPPNGVRFYQDLSNNRIWNYDLRFTIVAPLEAVATVDNKDKWKSLAATAIKAGVSAVGTVVEGACDSYRAAHPNTFLSKTLKYF